MIYRMYLVKFNDGLLDTVISETWDMAVLTAGALGMMHGGVDDVLELDVDPRRAQIDLCSHELKVPRARR